MNRDILKGEWTQLKGSLKEKWGELTDDDVVQINGDYERLVGKVQKRYGKEREQAQKEVDAYLEQRH